MSQWQGHISSCPQTLFGQLNNIKQIWKKSQKRTEVFFFEKNLAHSGHLSPSCFSHSAAVALCCNTRGLHWDSQNGKHAIGRFDSLHQQNSHFPLLTDVIELSTIFVNCDDKTFSKFAKWPLSCSLSSWADHPLRKDVNVYHNLKHSVLLSCSLSRIINGAGTKRGQGSTKYWLLRNSAFQHAKAE